MHHPELVFSDLENQKIQVVSAVDDKAYPGSTLHRTMILLTDEAFPNPLLIDVYRVDAIEGSEVDLPLWFQGQLIGTDFDYSRELTTMQTLGDKDGYQHIWKEAIGIAQKESASITWFENDKFYTSTFATKEGDELIFGKAGANDPNFNLRNDPVLIHRKKDCSQALFASVIESHGTYSSISEIPLNPYPNIKQIVVLQADENYSIIKIYDVNDNSWLIGISNNTLESTNGKHSLVIDNKELSWTGPYICLLYTSPSPRDRG